ncbi:MAG: 4-(cytidine 5'-diphospho)-2-C-methyl-D-erythritol kinase [Micropepsaceae bacterium]
MIAAQAAHRFAPAKVNLYLHVGDRREDGYHNLQSLVVFADAGDNLTVSEGKRLSLDISGPFAGSLEHDADNLVIKAAQSLVDWARHNGHKTRPARLQLEKNLPVASGIGGGSSDAAATLLLLAQYWSLPIHSDDLCDIGKSIGADVPVCLKAAPSLMSGAGEVLAPAPDLPAFAFVLVNPGLALPTADVFRNLKIRSGTDAPVWPAKFRDLRDFVAWLDRTGNDLSSAARAMAPDIMRVEQALIATQGCLLARMSGSGATHFGIFPTLEAAATSAEQIRSAQPDWWVSSCRPFNCTPR